MSEAPKKTSTETSVKTSVETSCEGNRVHCSVDMRKEYYTIECGCEEDFSYTIDKKVVESLGLPEHEADHKISSHLYSSLPEKCLLASALSIAYGVENTHIRLKFGINNHTKQGTDLINELTKGKYEQADKF